MTGSVDVLEVMENCQLQLAWSGLMEQSNDLINAREAVMAMMRAWQSYDLAQYNYETWMSGPSRDEKVARSLAEGIGTTKERLKAAVAKCRGEKP